ncbi:potassium transporter Kup [Haloferula sargassicola]|uniref:Probable potassium transport system protein Kup n=1 Tax=Haloferula sargassicola TaxID=490096 RepID=A0ABP9UGS4_9BACT
MDKPFSEKIKKPALPVIAALGVVFGDIGTSPLYAFRECFGGAGSAPVSPENLSGAASLIVWSLVFVISLKYLIFILRLDHHGEGGILALATLVESKVEKSHTAARFILLGIAGSALIYADGMLTPAISVLGAVEGLAVSAPAVEHWIVPLTVVILLGLFAVQAKGTGTVGRFFGPVIGLWFASLAVLGVRGILMDPSVLAGLSPHAGITFLIREWQHGLPVLGAVFLAVTGGEALYADLGHFGARPIRLAWFIVVFPALVLNYLGQAALLSVAPAALKNPFYLLAPDALRFPLTLLATAAAVIASQALISGAFSLTSQAVQLGCLPRIRIRHTSAKQQGQVFVPGVNGALGVACVLVVLGFRSSGNLAGAYGIAIALTMAITSVLFFSAARRVWGWPLGKALAVSAAFLVVDLAFLVANSTKILQGGWLPIGVAVFMMIMMTTWLWGRRRTRLREQEEETDMEAFLGQVQRGEIQRVEGLAVYLNGFADTIPGALLHNLKHNHVLHECVVMLHVEMLNRPRVFGHELGFAHEESGAGIHQVTLRFGFLDEPDIPAAMERFLPEELGFEPRAASYFLGRETYGVPPREGWPGRLRWRFFNLMSRNASSAVDYFNLPTNRVVELGARMSCDEE